jgi:hypothetical protein
MSVVTKTGTLSAALDTVALIPRGEGMALVSISGTHTGVSLIIQGLINGTWINISALSLKTSIYEFGTLVIPSSASRSWIVPTALYDQVRVYCSAISTGSVSVSMYSGPGSFPIDSTGNVYAGDNVGNLVAFLPAGSGAANEVLVSTGPGILYKLVVTTAGATAGLIIYDNATTNSGTIVYSSPATHALGVYDINMPFSNGLTARKASTTCAAAVVYKLI